MFCYCTRRIVQNNKSSVWCFVPISWFTHHADAYLVWNFICLYKDKCGCGRKIDFYSSIKSILRQVISCCRRKSLTKFEFWLNENNKVHWYLMCQKIGIKEQKIHNKQINRLNRKKLNVKLFNWHVTKLNWVRTINFNCKG